MDNTDIGLNDAGLAEQIGFLEAHIEEFDATASNYSLENCRGSAIIAINYTFSYMDDLLTLFHGTMSACDSYLHKVQTNFASCEADNSVDGEN